MALGRISTFLTAEDIADPYLIDPSHDYAVDVNGDFCWEVAYKSNADGPKFDLGKGKGKGGKPEKKKPEGIDTKQKGQKRGLFGKRKPAEPVLPTSKESSSEKGDMSATPSAMNSKRGSLIKESVDPADDKPFDLMGLQLKIPKGSFVAIVGRVGSGKSSLLQSLIGEMRRTRGKVRFSCLFYLQMALNAKCRSFSRHLLRMCRRVLGS